MVRIAVRSSSALRLAGRVTASRVAAAKARAHRTINRSQGRASRIGILAVRAYRKLIKRERVSALAGEHLAIDERRVSVTPNCLGDWTIASADGAFFGISPLHRWRRSSIVKGDDSRARRVIGKPTL